jgi:Arc/MetJ-type ribon-helix-helix transcriptional regulator
MNEKSKASDWVTVKVKEDLVHEIDKEVANNVTLGIPRYRSRSDFVKFACLALLQRERRNKTKVGGEEIIVARK